jgi:hypothetical protein
MVPSYYFVLAKTLGAYLDIRLPVEKGLTPWNGG